MVLPAIDFTSIFPGIEALKIERGALFFANTVKFLSTYAWRKEGSLLCTSAGTARIGFAIRKGGCSWHFRNRQAIELYQAMNGTCQSTEVTIKLPYEATPDHAVIANVIRMVIDNKPSPNLQQ